MPTLDSAVRPTRPQHSKDLTLASYRAQVAGIDALTDREFAAVEWRCLEIIPQLVRPTSRSSPAAKEPD